MSSTKSAELSLEILKDPCHVPLSITTYTIATPTTLSTINKTNCKTELGEMVQAETTRGAQYRLLYAESWLQWLPTLWDLFGRQRSMWTRPLLAPFFCQYAKPRAVLWPSSLTVGVHYQIMRGAEKVPLPGKSRAHNS